MKRLIFLDIDGVLATEKCWRESVSQHPEFAYAWDKECVGRLNEILESTGAEIVFSSAWRLGYNHELGNIKALFDHNEVNKYPIDVTPSIVKRMSEGWGDRSEEIQDWLERNRGKWDTFIILDDDFIYGFGDRLIPCEPATGITEEIKNKAIGLLNFSPVFSEK